MITAMGYVEIIDRGAAGLAIGFICPFCGLAGQSPGVWLTRPRVFKFPLDFTCYESNNELSEKKIRKDNFNF